MGKRSVLPVFRSIIVVGFILFFFVVASSKPWLKAPLRALSPGAVNKPKGITTTATQQRQPRQQRKENKCHFGTHLTTYGVRIVACI